jgi:hypothetical protein
MTLLRPAAVLAVLVLAGCGGTTSKPADGGPSKDGGQSDPDKAEVKVNADALAREYATDAKAADAKYKSKVVEVEGVAKNPTVGVGDPAVTVGEHKGPGMDLPLLVVAAFRKAEGDKVGKLTQGQKVKVRGKCLGGQGTVNLVDCVLVDDAPGK